MGNIILAVEDELSRAAGQKIADSAGWNVEKVLSKNGKGYLHANFHKFCSTANHTAVFLLVDLDTSHPCAPSLLKEWTQDSPLPRLMFFRVAVREVESWLLADHEAMKVLLGDRGRLPLQPDTLQNPKEELLMLLKKVHKYVRDDVVRLDNGRILQGVAYNAILGQWVGEHWLPDRAAARSESLKRLLNRITFWGVAPAPTQGA